jgi:hypothetical protein
VVGVQRERAITWNLIRSGETKDPRNAYAGPPLLLSLPRDSVAAVA